MEIILGARQTGKTTVLIKRSAETKESIVVYDKQATLRISRMADDLGLSIPFPLTYSEFVNHEYRGRGIYGVLIDNADRFLRFLSPVRIGAISINSRNIKTLPNT